MDGIAVKRYGGNDCGKDPKHHLSLVSPIDLSVFAKVDLPFDKDEQVDSGCCGGLLYFQGEKGKIVIINLKSQEMKVIDPPYFKPPPHFGFMNASGLGYDHKSRDYKLVRNYIQHYFDEEHVERYCGFEGHFQLYSFKSGVWKDISIPDACTITYPTGVYIGKTGSCYWLACGGVLDDPCCSHVLSFDFATESFDQFTLPSTITGEYEKLVECRGLLGVLVYWPGDETGDDEMSWFVRCSSSSPLSIVLFVWKERLWEMLYDVVTLDHHVRRPLGLHDGCLMFLEVEYSRQSSQLMVYNLDRRESEKLSTYDFRGNMTTTCYVESTYILPDSEPITVVPYVESSDPPPPDSSEDKERKIAIEMMLKKTRTGKGRKRKRMKSRAVSKNKPHSQKHRRLTTFICESLQQQ